MAAKRTIFLATALVGLASCSFIETRPGANNIRVMTAADVPRCDTLGTIETSALGKLGILDRDPATIDADLVKLARNHAVDMKGDTIVPGASKRPGERQFNVYRCMK